MPLITMAMLHHVFMSDLQVPSICEINAGHGLPVQSQLQSSQEREAALEEQLSAATRQLQVSQEALQAEQARLQEALQLVSGTC